MKRVLVSLRPQEKEAQEEFDACLIRLINDAWKRSWRNMRHAINTKEKQQEKRKSMSFFE